jgi:sugar phosphate isomerase/epimerase
MLHVGIATISFQTDSVDIALGRCAQAEARGVELWGRGHLPEEAGAGEVARVRGVAASLGLEIAAYGSYARAGAADWTPERFSRTLAIAADLGTPRVRVWAGTTGSADATPDDWDAVAGALAAWGEMAAARGITLVVERHNGTLTDYGDCAFRLLTRVNSPAVRLNYQAPYPMGPELAQNLTADLRLHLPLTAHLHAHNFRHADMTRVALAEGMVDFAAFTPLLREFAVEGWAMLEFLPEVDADLTDVARNELSWLRTVWQGC